MQKQTRANRLRINEPMRVALATLFFLFLLASASAQIIWQEDFSYPDGMAAGPGWAANAPGQCDANVGQWGVYGGQFVGNDIEGFNCCPCAGGPPNNCGDNNNVIQFGPFDISNFCDVSLNFTFGASGSMECIGGGCPGMPPIGCVGNGHDQAVFNYSIDGGPPVEFGFYCGNFLCSGGPSVTGINGNTFSFTIAMGNQAVSETYFFDDMILQGNQRPMPIPNYNPPLCTGQTLQLTETSGAGTSWQWAGPNGFSSSVQNPSIPNVSALNAGTYTVTVSNGPGCTGVQTVDVIIGSGAMVSLGPDQSVCQNDPPIILNAGPGFSSYAWSPAGSGQSVMISTATPLPTTQYSVTVTDASGCTGTSSVFVTIDPTPDIVNPGNQQSCGIYTLPPITGTNLSGSQSYYLGPGGTGISFPPGSAVISTQTFFIYDANGNCTDEESFTVTISPGPDIINPGNQQACGSYILPPITGSNLTGNQSYYDGPGGTGNAYLPGTPITMTTVLFIYDSAGTCFDEESFTVTINPTPVINNPGNQQACDSYLLPPITGTNLSGTATYYDGPGGTGTAYFPGTSITTSTLLFIYDANGSCIAEESFSVTINPSPDVNNPGSFIGCGTYLLPPITGTNLSGSEAYYDGPGGTGTAYFPGTIISNSITLFVYDAVGTCSDEEFFTITLNPTPSLNNPGNQEVCDSYLLPAISGMNLSGSEAYYDSPGGTGTQFLPGTIINTTSTIFLYDANGSCFDEAVFTVTVNATPDITNPGDQTVCGSYTLPPIAGVGLTGNQGYFDNIGGTGRTYFPGDMITSTTVLYLYDANGSCFDEEVFAITITPAPVITNPGDQTVCDSYTLPTISGTDLTGNQGYFDAPNGGGTAYNAGDNITATTTLYIYDAAGACSDEETFTVTIAPTPIVNNPGNQNVCDSYTLPAITGTNLSGSQGYFDAPNGGGTAYNAGDNITATTTLYIYDAAGACSDEETFTVTVAPTPIVNNPGNQNVCDSYTLPAITGTNLSGSQGYFDAPNGGGTAYNAGDNITATTTLYIYDAAGACSDEETFTVTVAPTPIVNNPGNQNVCDSYTLPAITGTNLSGSQGYFDAPNGGGTAYSAGDNISTTTTLYIYDATGACSDEETFTITVNNQPDAGTDNTVTVCEGSSLDLNTALMGADTGGSFTDNSATGALSGSTFNTTGLAGSTYTFTYELSAAAPCTPDQATITVTVATAVTAGLDNSDAVCDGASIDLFSVLDGGDLGGTFSDDDGSGGLSGSTFNSTGLSGSFNFTYTVGDGVVCPIDQAVINITIQAAPNIDPITDETACDSYTLTPIGGSNLSGNVAYYDAPNGGGTQYLPGANINSNIRLYAYDEVSGCTDEIDFLITILTSPSIDPMTAVTECGSYTLPTISGSNLSGSQTYYDAPGGTGVSYSAGQTVNSSITLYAYDSNGNCSDEAPLVITITPSPDLTPIGDQNGCDSYTLPAINGTNLTGGEAYYTAPNGGGITYSPGDNISSSTTLYIYDGAANCFDEIAFLVNINNQPEAGLDNAVTVCEGSQLDLTTALSGGDLGGNFNDDDATGALTGNIFNTTGLAGNSYTFTYTLTGGPPCVDDQATITVTVATAVTAGLDNGTSVCAGEALDLITVLNGGDLGGSFNDDDGSGGLSGNLLNTAGLSGNYNFTYTVGDGIVCPVDESLLTITVQSNPDIDVIGDQSACGSFLLPAITGTNLSGNEAYFDAPNGGGTQYLPGQSFSSSISLFIYDISNNGCSDEQTLNIIITPEPEAGADNTVSACIGSQIDLTTALAGADSGGSFNDDDGTGALSGTTFNTNGLSSGMYNFTYTVNAAAPCTPDQALITVELVNSVTAGNDNSTTLCQGAPIDLISLLDGGDLGGTFTDNNGSGALSGSVFNSSGLTGSYSFTYTVGNGVVCPEDQAELTVSISEPPAITAVPVAESCGDYVLPAIAGSNLSGGEAYYDAPNGGGTQYLAGQSISSSITLYLYDINSEGCSDEELLSITISTQPEAGVDNTVSVCVGSQLDLTTALSGADAGGSFTDDSSTGALSGSVFNTTGLASGSYNFTYSIAATAPCQSDQASITVDVVNTVTAGNDNTQALCEGDQIDLTSLLDGGDLGGSFNDDNGSGGLTGSTINTSGLNGNYQFTYTVGDGQICPEDQALIEVNVVATPVLDQPMDLSDCGTITLPTISGSNVSTNAAYYTGPGGTGTQYAAGDPITSSTLLYIFDDNGNCSDELTFNVTVTPGPALDPVMDALACESFTLPTISGSDLSGNQAYFTGPNGSGTQFLPGAMISNSTSLFVYDNNNGCEVETSFTITINQPVEAGNDNFILACLGASIDLTTTIQGADPGGTFIDDGGTGALTGTVFNSTGLNAGLYTFTYQVSGNTPCPNDEAVISINLLGAPSAGNDNAEQVCAGATVDLTTLLDGADLGGTFTDDSSSGGLSGDQLNTAGLNGSYQFTYSVGGGAICPVDEAILTVNVAPQPQLDMIPDQSGCNSLVLSGIAGSNLSGNVSYFDGPGGTGIAYQPGDVISSTTTLYAYDNNGNCADEQSFTITINTAPTFGTVTVDCDDIAGTYTVSFDIIGGDPISYIVNGNSGVLTNNNFVSDPITSGDPYSFTLDDANGCGPELLEGTQTCACTGTDAGQLSPASLRVCATSAATFTSTNTILNPDDALLFLLHEGDLTTIGNILSTSPTPIFSFDPTTMSTGQTYFVHALAGTSDGNGFIDLNDLCLSQSPGVELSFDPEITGSISGDAAICQGEGTLLTFTLGGGSTFDVTFGSPGNSTTLTGISDGHQELVSPTVTTTYTLLNVSVLNSACNLIQPSNAVTVAVSDLSVQLAVDSDFGGFATSCSNSTDGQASAQISDGVGPYSYLWSDGSTEAVASGLLAGAYGLTVTDAAGCTAIGSVQLTGPQAIEAVVEVQRPTCFDSEDGSITIDTVLGGARPVEVSLDGQLFTQIQDFPFTLSSLPAGNYELTIQDINDCATTTATSVDAPDQLIVVLSADDTLQQGLTADVTTTINFDPVEINWLTDVGLSCTDCLNPSFVVVEDANLTLVAFDENGCSATDDVFIRALKARNVYIPTAFSPNGDGRNETFEVYPGPNVAEVLSLRIFDRWGDLVYEGQPQGAGEGWDGFFKGKLMNPAVFVYVAEVLFVDGVTRIYKGDVTLLR